jgi:hypothetical protein
MTKHTETTDQHATEQFVFSSYPSIVTQKRKGLLDYDLLHKIEGWMLHKTR